MDELFRKKTDRTSIQLFRYTLVGGVAYSIDISSLFLITEFLHVHYLISAAIAFFLGLITNYSLSVKWVFNKRTQKNKLSEFAIFSLIGLVGLALNELFIWFFTEYFLFHYLISKILSTVFVYLWNFFARKYALFD